MPGGRAPSAPGGAFGISRAERDAAIIAFAKEGLRPAEIARRMGAAGPNNAIRTVLSRARLTDPTIPAFGAGREPGRVLLYGDLLTSLHREARRRHMQTRDLVNRLLATAVEDKLIDAILDDGTAS